MFQSTHPHGVRPIPEEKIYSMTSFNPRTHTGCDALFLFFSLPPSYVSIHAPTRGATPIVYFQGDANIGFNPRTHTGCDMYRPQLNRFPYSRFNPRTHTGCDLLRPRRATGLRLVSIHAPTRGATAALHQSELAAHMFQSTHPHGVRRFKPTTIAL